MLPAAPPRLSTITGRDHIVCSWFAMRRDAMSFTPPGGNGTMRRTGRSGKRDSAANAAVLNSARTAMTKLRIRHDISRRCPQHRRALHVPALRLIEIAEREMHRASVVPHDDVVLAPLMPVNKFEARGVL